jgi:hypothetical protein
VNSGLDYMRNRWGFVAGTVVFWLLSGFVYAADAPECRNGSFPAQEVKFGLARVIGGPRTYLRSDTGPCPNDTVACRSHSYVVPGDVVLTGMTIGAYACVLFPGAAGGSSGYVRRDEIMPEQLPSVIPLTVWRGTWRDGDNTIVLHIHDARLAVSGEAYWPSAHPSPRFRPGGPNVGDLSGTAMPSDNTIVVGEDPLGCSAIIRLLPPYLMVLDNKNCGGLNVSFTGVYRRR